MIALLAELTSNLIPKTLQSLLLKVLWGNLWCGIGFENLDPHIGENPVVITLWHEYLAVAPAFLPLIAERRGRNSISMCALVSLHKDGRMAGRIANEFGVIPVAGSTTRGGSNALRRLSQLTKRLKFSVLITPDGPRGPRRTSEHGLSIGPLSDLPVLPAAAANRKAVHLASWDNMVLPSPSNTGVLVFDTSMMLTPFCEGETKAMVIIRLNGTASRAGWTC